MAKIRHFVLLDSDGEALTIVSTSNKFKIQRLEYLSNYLDMGIIEVSKISVDEAIKDYQRTKEDFE